MVYTGTIHLSSSHKFGSNLPSPISAPMANINPTATKPLPFLLLFPPFLSFIAAVAALGTSPSRSTPPPPTPAPWPHQFHSLLYVNYSGNLSLIDLWYDWPNGRNFNIIRAQLQGDSDVLYDLEWNNGTSYLYTLGGPAPHCQTLYPGVGILRPNWLDGAEYLGQETVDGFLCNVWQKVDFIWYYEDVVTKRPVHWVFYTGRSIHVMTFEVGAAMGDEQWQAPVYCFEKETKEKGKGHLGGIVAMGLPETLGSSRKLVLPK